MRIHALLLMVTLAAATLGGTAAAAPAGNAVVYPIVADPTFNPWHPRAFVESVFPNRVIFNGLTKPGKNLQPAPDLAERWEVSRDGLTWTFFLRRNVRWHDGTEFTAEDVKFTYGLVTDPKLGAGGAANFRVIKEIQVVDKYTVRFTLTSPTASLAAFLGTNAGIIPKHAFEGVADPWAHDAFNKRQPIGTGAFKVGQYVPGSHVTLVRNDQYFLGRPALDSVTFKVLPDANAQIAQLISGDLTLIMVDNPASARALASRSDVAVSTVLQTNFYWLCVNHTIPWLADVRVKQAMMYAMDRKAMINGFLSGYAREATGIISPALSYYYRGTGVKTYEFDRAKARQLLAEAGWRPGPDGILVKDGRQLKFALTYPRVQFFEQLAALVQQYFRAVGIEVTHDALEFNQFVSQRLLPRRYEVIAGWWITPSDPDFFNYVHSSNATRGFNIPLYPGKASDQLLERGRASGDPAERARIYEQWQRLVAEELPYLYLWWPFEIRAINRRLSGVPAIGLRDAFQWANEWSMR
jgi:peptide/nickel transport system substrate-binding protein